MSSPYKVVDISTWKRRIHYQVFKDSLQPQYAIGVELDVTAFLEKIKKYNYSFTLSIIYAVTKCANEIEEFRYRFINDEVVLFDQIHTAFTYLNQETELFKVVNVEMKESIEAYIQAATAAEKSQKEYFTGPLGNDVFQFSPLPWISFTHISHTISGNNKNATPLFDWGKYFNRDNRVLLPFSVQVHHSFVDGIHVAKLLDRLQRYLDAEKF